MKKTLRTMVFTAIAMLFSVQVIAEGTYFGGNYTALDYEVSGVDGFSVSIDMINLRLGNQFNDVLSGEVRLGFGLSDDSLVVAGNDTRIDISLETLIGFYVRASLPTDTLVKPYALLGYNRIELEAETAFDSVSESENDIALGLGVDFELSEELDLNAEYISFYDKDNIEISGLTIGVAHAF